MVELNQIYVGSRVKIVDNWNECLPPRGQNHSGHMDRYLGMVVTVSAVSTGGSDSFQIEEDTRFRDEHGRDPITSWDRNHRWYFFPKMIDYVLVDEEEPSFEAIKIDMSSVLGIQSQPIVG